MAEDTIPTVVPPALFTMDLGENGGVLAPTSAEDLFRWVDSEVQAWSWLTSVSGGNHKAAIDNNLSAIRNAQGLAQQARQYETSNPTAAAQYYGQIQAAVQDTYIARGVPHSSSPLGRRIEEIRKHDPLEAVGFFYTRMTNANNYPFDARDLSSWKGFLSGLTELVAVGSIPQQSFQAALDSLSGTRAEAERLLAEKTETYNALHRDYAQLSADVTTRRENQEAQFQAFLGTSQKSQDDALAAHQERMNALEGAFREEMTLRAPVEYWESRQTHHEKRTTALGRWSFGAMIVLTLAMGTIAAWVLQNLSPDGKPEAWRVSVLVLVGVLGVWATRLLVRMFLSHIHLATDAAERVVMVKTYLSLLEGDKLPSDDDRKLILQSLFRPASDGIVKDEGLPHPALDMLTRLGGR